MPTTATLEKPTPPEPGPPPRNARGRLAGVVALGRNTWRTLTSMRTALVLLFLLALAAIPGALLPQRSVDESLTTQYIADHRLGTWMDRLELFNVFESRWFTAIYLLLFISLVGCLLPRTREHLLALRTAPVKTPRNLARLPRHETRTTTTSVDETAAAIMGNLRGWRKISRTMPDGTIEISAEKGYLRELGNLIFHFSLIGLLIAIAVGKVYGYEGSRIVVANGQSFCNSTTSNFDSFRSGSLNDGTDLTPFCIKVNDFEAGFLPNGQAESFESSIGYQDGAHLADPNADPNEWTPYRLRTNHPLRLDGDRVYLLGHGYAPTFTVTFTNGESRTETAPFRPDDKINFLSSGVLRIDPPAGMYPDEDERRKHQIAIDGLFAPTKIMNGSVLGSQFPAMNDPAVAVDLYVGDTGLDTGRPQNVFSLSNDQINAGRLEKQERVNLDLGQSSTLPDGTVVRFDGATPFVSLQVSHDPAQKYVLVFAITMLVGLVGSLLIKRRRIFARITGPTQIDGRGDAGTVESAQVSSAAPNDAHTRVELAGLARTDHAGWGEDFAQQTDRLIHGRNYSPAESEGTTHGHQ